MRASVERLMGDPAPDVLLGSARPRDADAAGVVQLRLRHSVWAGADEACLVAIYVCDRAR